MSYKSLSKKAPLPQDIESLLSALSAEINKLGKNRGKIFIKISLTESKHNHTYNSDDKYLMVEKY